MLEHHMDTISASLEQRALLHQLGTQAEQIVAADASFWQLQDALKALVASGFFNDWLNTQLSTFADPTAEPALWLWPRPVVARWGQVSLHLSVIEAEPERFSTCACAAILSPVCGHLACDEYQLPEHRNDVFEPALQAQWTGTRLIGVGDVLCIPAGSLKTLTPSPQHGALVCAELCHADTIAYVWNFDNQTLTAKKAVAQHPVHTQLQASAQVLAVLKHVDSIDVLSELASHPNYEVRWSAIQAIARIAPSKATPLIERATSDAHPQIQAAARRTLQSRGHSHS
jgi:hypothetical protein